MNLFEVVSEKFLDVNAAKVIANYPERFVKLLIKKLEKEVGKVKNKVSDKKDKWLFEPIFKRDRRGELTTGFPKSRLDISIQPKGTSGAQWVPTYHIMLELSPSMKLEISPTKELVDITRMTLDELIDKIVDMAKKQKEQRHKPEEIHLKSIKKIMTDHGLKLEAGYYKGLTEDEYDYLFNVHMADGKSFEEKDTAELYRVVPAIMKWHNANNMVLKRHGFAGNNDYYYLESIHQQDTHEENKDMYRDIAATKAKIIGRIFSSEE